MRDLRVEQPLLALRGLRAPEEVRDLGSENSLERDEPSAVGSELPGALRALVDLCISYI